jgi:hypothetical protein
MGVPEDWSVVESWSTDEPPFFKDSVYESKDISDKKNPGQNYAGPLLENISGKGTAQRANDKSKYQTVGKSS